VLAAGEPLTFARVAEAAEVPERTVYRHFPSREALMEGLFAWANERIGFDGALPADRAELVSMVRTVFPGFDEIAPVIRELMAAPEGRHARLAGKPQRQAGSLAVIDAEQVELDDDDRRRVAAITQLLAAASTWQTLRDYWDMDGDQAAEAVGLAIELIFDGIECRTRHRSKARRRSSATGRS
jgi:AcrR family transcriptional regulator